MRSFALLATTLALAACPKQQTGTGTSSPQAGAGCPPAKGVYIASYVQQEPGKGRSGWVVPLHATAGAADVDYRPLSREEASAQAVPPAPTGTLWLASASGQPCRGTVGRYYAARIDGSAPGVSYGFELDGCPAPANAEEGGGIVLVSDQAPTGCRFEAPQPIAARLGEMNAQKQWQRPTRETPIPAPLAALVEDKPCAAPGCEKLWAFAEVRVDGKPVAWTGAVNWLSVGDPAQQCSWPAERFSGIFVPKADGSVEKLVAGSPRSLVLSAVLADASGPKVLLAEGPGEYVTYDVGRGNDGVGNAFTWMAAPPEAWEAVDHIGPICDAPQR